MAQSASEKLFAQDISRKDKIIAVKVNGILKDLNTPVQNDDTIEPVFYDSPEGIEILRHSTSHVMAQAVKRLFPSAKVTIGPSTEDGFYYDFYYPPGFKPEDIEKIEKEMKRIIKEDLKFTRKEMTKEEAIEFFKKIGESYKIEIINEIPEENVSLYEQGEFVDLCRGPHLPSTKFIKHFKLLSVAGAYWRGDEKREMLQRIYGTAFPEKSQLEQYLHLLEEAKRRDHRKLGKELDLFSIDEDIGSGLILWHPRGAIVRKIIEDFWREEHIKNDYQIIYTPHIARLHLLDTSGHTQFYRENMYAPIDIDGVKFQLKPMNCPFHITIYKSQIRSYRNLPIRFAELGTVYRYEKTGVLHGLLRVRGFTQDDAHIFVTPEGLEEEILAVIRFTIYMLKTFGFSEYDVFLSTRPEKFVGPVENWERATNALKSALEKLNINYRLDPGEGVFYGPKIDIKIKDVLGRPWQCSTIQVDFNLPEKFDVTYIDKDNQRHRPVMIHRALMGSLERFFGMLIEHYAGDFPLWLAPVQTAVIPVSEKSLDYAKDISKRLKEAQIRVEEFFENDKLGYKIRNAELKKIPYIVVLGEEEKKRRTLSVRDRVERKEKRGILLENFIEAINNRIKLKK